MVDNLFYKLLPIVKQVRFLSRESGKINFLVSESQENH